jgi:hypothetical protein
LGELALGWSSAEFAEEHLFCGIDATGQRTKSTRHQVVGPCRVEDGTAYAHNGVALERNTASGIPTSSRFHEAQRTSPTQFATVNMVRERPADLGNNPIDDSERTRKVFEAHGAFRGNTDICVNDSAFSRTGTRIQ